MSSFTTALLATLLIGLAGCGDTHDSECGWDLVIVGAPAGDTLAIDRRVDTGEIDGFILSATASPRSDTLVVPCGLDQCVVLSGRLLCAGGTWHACIDLDASVACGATTFVCTDSYEWEASDP